VSETEANENAVTDFSSSSAMLDDVQSESATLPSSSSSSNKGSFYIHAYSAGVAVEGKVLPAGTRAALSSGSVISFGVTSTAETISFHQPKIITQFLLPSSTDLGSDVHSNKKVAVTAKSLRSSEKLMLAALRLATQDHELRRFLPSLFSSASM
jgi:hypothetical protein